MIQFTKFSWNTSAIHASGSLSFSLKNSFYLSFTPLLFMLNFLHILRPSIIIVFNLKNLKKEGSIPIKQRNLYTKCFHDSTCTVVHVSGQNFQIHSLLCYSYQIGVESYIYEVIGLWNNIMASCSLLANNNVFFDTGSFWSTPGSPEFTICMIV